MIVDNMKFNDKIYNVMTGKVVKKYPTGKVSAVAVRLQSGRILINSTPDSWGNKQSLYMEMGTVLEAHKRHETITHSICVSRESEDLEFKIQSPSSICQERMSHWSNDTQVAISNSQNKVIFKKVRELM